MLSLSDNWLSIPFSDLKRQFFATKPKDVDGLLTTSTMYYQEYLLKKIFAIFDFSLPDTWDLDYFQQHLFLDGYIAVTDTDAGILPLQCSFSGINVFSHPTDIIIANPVLGSFERKIGVNGVLIKLQYNYMGIHALLNRYAALLAMCDSALSVNLMNSKVAFIGMAENKAQADTMKKMYDEISMGKPAVFVKGSAIGNGESFYFNRVKENYIAKDIQDTKRSLINEFLTEIGINNANINKRERLNLDEVNANDEEIRANVQHWYDNIRAGFDEVNAMFTDLNISVKIRDYTRIIEAEEGGIDESSKLG